MLVFRLSQPARLLISVYGPGPSCERLGTFRRRGRAGVNRLPVSGRLFGRPLAPGRYAIVVEALRPRERVRIGRVLVTILAPDGRAGARRLFAAPTCASGAAWTAFLASAGGNLGSTAGSSSGGAAPGRSAAGGVAGVAAGRGGDDESGGGSLLPQLPALPAIPSVPLNDSFDVPPWALPALAILVALGALAFVAFGFRRYRENAGGGWD